MSDLPLEVQFKIDRLEQHFRSFAEYTEIIEGLGHENSMMAFEELLARLEGRSLLFLIAEASSIAFAYGLNGTSLQFCLTAILAYDGHITPDDTSMLSEFSFQRMPTLLMADPIANRIPISASATLMRAICETSRNVGAPIPSPILDPQDDSAALAWEQPQNQTKQFGDVLESILRRMFGTDFDIEKLATPYAR